MINEGGSVNFNGDVSGKSPKTYDWTFQGGSPAASTQQNVNVTYASPGSYNATLDGTNGKGQSCSASTTVTVNATGGNVPPTANDDAYETATDVQLVVNAPGVLGNDTDPDQGDTITVADPRVGASTGLGGTVTLNTDGSFTYDPPAATTGDDTFTYVATDGADTSNTATVTITISDAPPPPTLPNQTDFKMMMNYELGMHCTGFEFAYCCVLPVYNSIIAQVVKPNKTAPNHGGDFPRLLDASTSNNTSADVLGRHTVLRDMELDGSGEFAKYVLRYWHDAQPRNDGNGKAQSSTLISQVEGNSLLAWGTVADAAKIDAGDGSGCGANTGDYVRGAMVTGEYNGATGVVLGNGSYADTGCTFGVNIDNYQNVVWNHLYIYEISAAGVEGHKPDGTGTGEDEKFRLGLHVDYPTNFGPGGHGMEGQLTY